MRFVLFLAAFVALSATAASFTTPSGDICTVTCTSGGVPPPPPVDPCAGFSWTAMQPRTPFGSAVYSGLGPSSTALLHYGTLGTVYSAPLQKAASGLYGSGFLQQSDHPGTPTELTIEWAISKCPGDFEYYKSDEAAVVVALRGGASAVYHPCGGINGASGTTIRWSPVGSFYECKVTDPGPWYMNVRYLSNCSGGNGCPVAFYHTER